MTHSDQHTIKFLARFKIGDRVHMVVDSLRNVGMVTGYIVRPDSHNYFVVWADAAESQHFEIELEGVDDDT